MIQRYLEVTFRNGKALAAYLYLPRNPGDVSVRTVQHGEGLLIDFAAYGSPIGIEITSPTRVSLEALSRALTSVSQAPATAEQLRPLAAA